jgi:hypothetical protein
MSADLSITEQTIIGENAYYRFFVGRMGERWVGFAAESATAHAARQLLLAEGLNPIPDKIFLFPDVSGQGDECHLPGVPDRARAIRMTGAIAQDPGHAYGGIDRWHVPDELRGKPEDFRCARCDWFGCDGTACAECVSPEDLEDFYP